MLTMQATLKQFITDLMIVVNLLYFSSTHLFLFSCIFNKSVYAALAPWKKKKIWTTCTFFLFSFICFKCYCFCLWGIKTKPYSANKVKLFARFIFVIETLFTFILKKFLALYLERPGVCCHVSHICLHLIFFFVNLYESYLGHIPHLMKDKKADKVCIYKFSYSIW